MSRSSAWCAFPARAATSRPNGPGCAPRSASGPRRGSSSSAIRVTTRATSYAASPRSRSTTCARSDERHSSKDCMTTDFYQAISGSAARFRALLPRAAETQKQRLLALLRRNAGTEFGRLHGFASIRDEDEYRARVPVASYEDLRPAIERMAAGEPDVLVSGRVIAFEETGGSTGGAKLIPFTAEALAAFRRALVPWLDALAAA